MEYIKQTLDYYPRMKRCFGLILFTILIVAIIAIDMIFSKEFMNQSIELSLWLQKFNFYLVSIFFSYFLIGAAFIFLFMFFFLSEDKQQGFLTLFGIMICFWLHGFVKLLLMDSRPSFLSEKLRNDALFCVKEFGKPSGHALFSFYNFLIIGKILENRYFKGQPIKIVACFLINCIIAGIIGLTRFYFGVHSFNQVIIGALFGSYVYFLVDFYKEGIIKYLYRPIFERKNENSRQTFLLLIAIFSIFFTLSLLNFFRAHSILLIDTSFYDSIINCLGAKTNFIYNFTVKMELNCIYFIFFNFFMIGLLFNEFNVKDGLSFGYDSDFKLIIARFLIFFASLIPFILLPFIRLDEGIFTILGQSIIISVTSFFSGKYLFKIMDWVSIPFKREPSDIENPKEMLEINQFKI